MNASLASTSSSGLSVGVIHAGCTVLAMKETELFRWYIPKFSSSKLYLSRYHMSVEQAQRGYPGCNPDPMTREVWMLPETR